MTERDDTDTLVRDLVDEDRFPRTGNEQPVLTILSGLDTGKVFRLPHGATVLGRRPGSDILLNDEGISRSHAKIDVKSDGRVVLSDLASTNGTRLNDTVVDHDAVEVRGGDLVYLGKSVVLKFSFLDELEEGVHRMLYDAAVQDPLTRIYNKRYLVERFEQEFAFARRHERPLSLLIYDLDRFKRVNDDHGHVIGDQLLVATVRAVQAQIRREDIFARYGGEEFVLLMRETSLEHAIDMGERIRRVISATTVETEDGTVTATASLGLTCTSVFLPPTAMELFIRADKLLYEAKRAGRNHLCWDKG